MKKCYLCDSNNLIELLNLGPQPISNRFLSRPDEEEYTYPLVLNQCPVCGLIQINDMVSARELAPAYDWLTYSEPEGHLDQLTETIANLPGVDSHSRFCGISFKDDTTLRRLERQGLKQTYRVDPQKDLGIHQRGAGAETIQERLTPEAAAKITQERGKFDVVIVRHILEHAHRPDIFISALKELIQPQGYIVFEVPDCSRALENCDYTTIWEEHTMYFTPITFRNGLNRLGFPISHYHCYPYPFENSLIGIAQGQNLSASLPDEIIQEECQRGRIFAENLPRYAQGLKKFLAAYRKNHGEIAFFGAGHLACVFVNLLGIRDFIDFFVDDNPHKKGLWMPGSRLPIYESTALLRENVKLCLLSLNPLSEEKVLKANQNFLKQGGTSFSIFPGSKIALPFYQEIAMGKYPYADQRI